jgi:hypothetical protein
MRIVHKCRTCGHLDTAGWRSGDQPAGAPLGSNTYQWPRLSCRQGCKGCERTCDWGPSQLSVTYAWPHQPEQQLYRPGETYVSIMQCGCDECRSLYAETVNA